MTLQDTTITDKGCECYQRLQPTSGATQQQTHISNGETFSAYSTSRPSTPTRKESESPTNTPHNSVTSSTDASSQRASYAESTNDESNGLSVHDRDRRRGSRASGLSAGSSSRGAWGEHQDGKVWAQDKERKHRKLFEKIFDHKLAPDFLK